MIGHREFRTGGAPEFTSAPQTADDVPMIPARRPPLPAPAPMGVTGFRALLDDASLWDLVQMECLTRARRVIQVTGEGGIGYLYFSVGRVVHAVTRRRSGIEAALEILGWTNGVFQACERTWPSAPTIEASQEALILLAAKRRDEAEASNNLVAFRPPTDGIGEAEGSPSPQRQRQQEDNRAAETVEFYEIEEGSMSNISKPTSNVPVTAVPITPVVLARSEPLSDFSVMIRVAANGSIVKNKGGSEELAGVVAYTQMLVQLVGELLGLEPFQAMECTFKDNPATIAGGDGGGLGSGGVAGTTGPSRCLVFTEANGDVVALRPRPDANIQPLRESLGL